MTGSFRPSRKGCPGPSLFFFTLTASLLRRPPVEMGGKRKPGMNGRAVDLIYRDKELPCVRNQRTLFRLR